MRKIFSSPLSSIVFRYANMYFPFNPVQVFGNPPSGDADLQGRSSRRSRSGTADVFPPHQAKAGRVGSDITLSCVELAGTLGYSETELLEKWSRDSKILDIFEGTQQIQQLIVARRVLGLSSAELK